MLAHVDELKRQMVYRFQPKRWFGLLRRNTFATAVRASNSIEGIVVSVDDAVAAVEGEEPIDEKSENWFAVAGYRRAMTMVLQQAGVPYFEYSVGFLNSLHFMMLDFDLVRRPGNWRTGPIFVVDGERNEIVYDAPPAESLSDLMQALIEDLQRHEDLHPVVKAAMAHLNLVMIHPYSDGNGRMGRCLQSLVLARSGVLHPAFASVEEYLGRNTRDYYRVLAEVGQGRWNPMRDTRAWIRFMLTAHYRQATTLMRRSTFYQQLFDVLDEAAERLDLPERTVQAMADAVLGAKVRNATYRKLTDVSMRAAGRDLGLLVEAGFLEPMGKKRGRYYLAAPSLFELTRAVPRPAPVDDPFESLEKGELSFES
ncbi:MAG: Fic family protein [Acidobacteriota bacterium]